MKKVILLWLLSIIATSFAKTPLPSVDTSLGILDFNIPLISIPGKGIENLDFTIYYKKHSSSFKSPLPVGKMWTHSLQVVLHYKPYELKESKNYFLSPAQIPTVTPKTQSIPPPSLNFYHLPTRFHYYSHKTKERYGALYSGLPEDLKRIRSLPRIEIYEKGTYKVYQIDKDLFYEKGSETFYSSYHKKRKNISNRRWIYKGNSRWDKISFLPFILKGFS